MDVKSRIHIGYIYSLGIGLVRYEGAEMIYKEMLHKFSIVKPFVSPTRDVKPWQQYLRVHDLEDWSGDCIYFTREVFKLMEYQPALTVLYGV